jgi:hypothetical protein
LFLKEFYFQEKGREIFEEEAINTFQMTAQEKSGQEMTILHNIGRASSGHVGKGFIIRGAE